MATSILLAGGKSLRLGREKAFELLGGKSLIQRAVDRLSVVTDEIIVVTAAGKLLTCPSCRSPLRIIPDLYPGKGVLGGILTGLVSSDSLYNLAVACDMPFLNPSLLRHLLSLSPGFDVIIPRLGELLEPLHAIYSRNCIAPIEQSLKEGNLRAASFLSQVKVRYVEEEEIHQFDPEHLSFFNINTEADFERAKELLRFGSAKK